MVYEECILEGGQASTRCDGVPMNLFRIGWICGRMWYKRQMTRGDMSVFGSSRASRPASE
jgi:hypothetical protein